ncbi:MAG TPA: sn-glycerol-3-phosphate ABC transporter permease UgpA [Candidatus Sulfotelmatobacter sp.]|nr:sn-glycerol-3-phosphate ABC transporter permease UgpA [Candidatus Sulfotelmatobacter sp.]
MDRRAIFGNRVLPYLLVAPQLAVTLMFFFWPAGQVIYQSVLREDAFGLSSRFVWLDNFKDVLSDEFYLNSLGVTAIFSSSVAVLSLASALALAVLANSVVRGTHVYRTLLIWPYAVAPAVAGVLWLFMFHPSIGLFGRALNAAGIDWNWLLNGPQALLLVIVASAWKQVSYNFIFFLAGLQSIPRSVIEAAAIDGASPRYRFWTVVFPLLSPTAFFLLVVNVVYAFFDTFGVIHAVTGGGPGKATEILVYKVYYDGVVALDLGGSAAQSAILMAIVIAFTVVQFRYIEKKVHY